MESQGKEMVMYVGISVLSIVSGLLSLTLSWPDLVVALIGSAWFVNSIFCTFRCIIPHFVECKMLQEEGSPIEIALAILFPFWFLFMIYYVILSPLISLLILWLKSFAVVRTMFRGLFTRRRRKKMYVEGMKIKMRCEKRLLGAIRKLKRFIGELEAEKFIYEGDDLPDAAFHRTAITNALGAAKARLEKFERAHSDLANSAVVLNDSSRLRIIDRFERFDGDLDDLLAEVSDEIAANKGAGEVFRSLCEEHMPRQEA